MLRNHGVCLKKNGSKTNWWFEQIRFFVRYCLWVSTVILCHLRPTTRVRIVVLICEEAFKLKNRITKKQRSLEVVPFLSGTHFDGKDDVGSVFHHIILHHLHPWKITWNLKKNIVSKTAISFSNHLHVSCFVDIYIYTYIYIVSRYNKANCALHGLPLFSSDIFASLLRFISPFTSTCKRHRGVW